MEDTARCCLAVAAGPIRVVPARLDWLTALAESDAVFTERFGVPVEAGWIGFPEAGMGRWAPREYAAG